MNNTKSNLFYLKRILRRTTVKPNYIIPNVVSFFILPIRFFSTTFIRKGDPLGVTVLSYSHPYASSLLCNPLGGAFILLMGMAATLFFVTQSLPVFFAQDPSYAFILQRLDSLFLLYERFLLLEENGVAMLLANIGNFTPETLRNFYFLLQELVTVRESIFYILHNIINSPEIEFLERPALDRINTIFEDLRVGGNSLMILIRNIEDRLNIGAEERIPSF
jgi:hypothetical protein